jgi:hypothetical protein
VLSDAAENGKQHFVLVKWRREWGWGEREAIKRVEAINEKNFALVITWLS